MAAIEKSGRSKRYLLPLSWEFSIVPTLLSLTTQKDASKLNWQGQRQE